jgi:hypothetical protein
MHDTSVAAFLPWSVVAIVRLRQHHRIKCKLVVVMDLGTLQQDGYLQLLCFFDIIHRPIFYLKHDIADTVFCLSSGKS